MKAVHAIAFILVIVGAINWGLIGVNENWNVVGMLLGSWPVVESIVYVLVGLSGLSLVFSHRKDCKACEPKAEAAM
jgi:uncharacterized protein